jgi:DNA polymerase-3 subunit epsilon
MVPKETDKMDIVVRIYLDTETTGLDPSVHEVIEVAVVREEVEYPYTGPGKITLMWSRKVAPQHIETAEPVALKVNGYAPEAWANAVPFSTIAEELVEHLKGGMIIGHNPKFDTGFITAELKRAGVEPRISHRTIDTTTAAYMAWGLDGKMKLSLDNLRSHLGLSSDGAHTALQDALDCREVFYRALAARMESPDFSRGDD